MSGQSSGSVGASDVQSSIEKGVRNAFVGEFVPFPFKNGIKLFPAATDPNHIVIDFTTGEVNVPGVESFTAPTRTLKQVKKNNAFSGSLFTDGSVTITLKDSDGKLTGKVHPSGVGFVSFQGNKLAIMEITCQTPFTIGGTLSTGTMAPILPTPVSISATKVGHVPATAPIAIPVSFIPASRTDIVETDYNSPSVDAAISTYGNPLVFTSGIETSSFIVYNSGNYSVDYQVRGFDMTGQQNITDPDIHSGTSLNNFKTIGPGESDSLRSDFPLYAREVYAKDTNAGEPGALDIQFLGMSPNA